MDCIFCRIVSGEVPSGRVYETADSVAFLDAFPLARGHTLVVPRRHYAKIQGMPAGEASDLFEAVRVVSARAERLGPSVLVAVHNGREAGQEVPHVHVHVIPRKPGDGAGPVHSMFRDRPKMSEAETGEILGILRKG